MKCRYKYSLPARLLSSLLGLSLVVAQNLSAAELTTMRNPNTGLLSWKVSDRGFSLELIQLQSDFIRAVYASRDLPPAMREEVADYCAFGTVARNENDFPLAYRVADWRAVTADGVRHKLRTKSEWLAIWRKMGLDFGFSILPDDLTFEVGDWAQGFTTVKLPRGTKFDLVYVWRQHGKTLTGKITGLVCTTDAPPAPAP